MDITSILMVCRGNICRSPMAEGYFAKQFNDLKLSTLVSSAGLAALINQPADDHAQKIMVQHGVSLSSHRARQLTNNLVRKNDLILVMSYSQLQQLTSQFITAKGKTFLLGHWNQIEIEDPYTKPAEAFLKVYQKIESAWQKWKTRILQ